MADVVEQGERNGLSRRDMIKAAGIAGAAAWTAPVIIDSLASPAAAVSPGGFTCSYASIVFTPAGSTMVYAVKIDKSMTTCTNTNSTSGDESFSYPCDGSTYTNTCSGNAICKDGTAVQALPTGCPFTVNGSQVQADAGVNILFVAVHDGSFAGKFNSICAPGSSFDVGSLNCTGAS